MDNTTLLIILIVVQKPNRAGTGRGDLMLCFRATGGPPMPDDKTKVGEPDRSRVAADQNYEVRYLAQKFGLSDEQARELIARVGNDREKLDEAAQKLMSG
jgi:hypothetical protein